MVGTDYTNPNTIGGRLKPGYNDLYTWCKKNNRLDIIQAYLAAQVEGKNPEPMSTIPYHSYKKKAWFKCLTCGHLFEASPVYLTTRKNFCPACAARVGRSKATITGVNDLETWCRNNNRLDIAADYSLDNSRPISQIAANSHDRVKWICHKCGFTWEAPVLNRTTQNGNCKACSARVGKATRTVIGINDLETWCKQNSRQDIIDAWSPRNRIPMSRIGAKTDTVKIYLKCRICGEEIESYPAFAIKALNSTLCIHCKPQGTSVPQIALYNTIKENFRDALYRYKLQGYEADIYIPSIKLAIEYNGCMHLTSEAIQRDSNKIQIFDSLGVTTLVIQEQQTKSAQIKVDSNNPNRISLWYKLNTSKQLHDLVIAWINHHYNSKAIVSDEMLLHGIDKAREVISRKTVLGSIVETNPEILGDWDYEKNGNLKPEMFTHGSNKEVYWKCTKCSTSHSYLLSIKRKCMGRGCPILAGKRVCAGFNDLESAVPEFIKHCWDYEENNKKGLIPTEIARGSRKSVALRCPHCGYKWMADLYTIVGFRLKEKTTRPPKCPHCGRQLPFN